jgi:hypothetical protein
MGPHIVAVNSYLWLALIFCFVQWSPTAAERWILEDAMIETVEFKAGSPELWKEVDALRAHNRTMLEALREVETICSESVGDCRRRMGTRQGNSLGVSHR